MNRRTALSTLAVVPFATVSTRALATGTADQIDPVLAAHAEWQEAERLCEAAVTRIKRAGGDQCVTIPTATGGTRCAWFAAQIDQLIAEETAAAMIASAARAKASGDYRELPGDRYDAPDSDALRAELSDRKARHAAACKAENIDALDDAEGRACDRFIDTPATTAAGVALKLRAGGQADDAFIAAALCDLDRTDAPRIVMQAQEAPEGQGRGQTDVERLHARFVEALRASESSATDEILDRRAEITNAAQLALIEAQPVTPRDVALQVLSFRDSLEISGPFPDRMMAQLHALTGGAA